MNREPTLDELIGAEAGAAERQRLQHVHDLLLEAGPPPELSPELEAGPNLKMTVGRRRRVVKQRAMVLLAAAVAVLVVFLGGYLVANRGGSTSSTGSKPVITQTLKGTAQAPQAQGTLEVWRSRDGDNWPMTLSVVGLPKLPAHSYYEVYLFRDGKIRGSCGSFRVANPDNGVTVPLTSPYTLEHGDAWVVTRPGAGGAEPGQMVLRPVSA